MPNYFFTDSDGNKWGPLTEERLQTLIDRGTIVPTTSLTTDSGHTGLAGQIPGLNFDNVAPPPFNQTSQATSQKTVKYFYIDADGNKRGPYSEQQLQELVARGYIGLNTPLETDAGHRGRAREFSDLNLMAGGAYSQTNESAGTPWLFDFGFHDIRLPKNGRRACSFIYICCVITIVINGLLGFFLFNPMYSPETMTAAIIFLVCYIFSSFIFLVLVRVVCELLIVLLDWIAENKKASRLYVENNKKEQ